MRVEQAISKATVICFNVSQITKCFAQKLNEGMLTFIIADEGSAATAAQPTAMSRSTMTRPAMNAKVTETNILMSKADLVQAKTLLAKLQDKSIENLSPMQQRVVTHPASAN